MVTIKRLLGPATAHKEQVDVQGRNKGNALEHLSPPLSCQSPPPLMCLSPGKQPEKWCRYAFIEVKNETPSSPNVPRRKKNLKSCPKCV